MVTTLKRDLNQMFLEMAREEMATLLRSHVHGLGIDEVREHCELMGLVPENPSLWGAVVKDKRFVRNGDRRSQNKKTHGRWINIWKLR